MQNTAHVSSASFGFCDSYSDDKHNNCSFDAIKVSYIQNWSENNYSAIIMCLLPRLQNTAPVSSACIGFCDSYSDEKHNNYNR